MKYLITLLALIFFIPASPNGLHVYNNTSSYMLYYKIGAKPSNGNAYPVLYSMGLTGHFVSLGPLLDTSYINAGGFPFYSPTSMPIITTWERQLNATSTPINTLSPLAQTLFGATHRYSQFKFYVEDNNGIVIGSGNVDPVNLTIPTQNSIGNGLWVSYFPTDDGSVHILLD